MGIANFVWTTIFLGSAAYIVRKDLSKVFRVLERPVQNFVRDVKAEMDANSSGKDGTPKTLPGAGASAEATPVKPVETEKISEKKSE